MIAVCVFAHNEERHITRCLASVPPRIGDEPVRIHVVANGCRDATAARVRDVMAKRPEISLSVLAEGDKSHAWNVHVHGPAGEARHQVFLDGDCYAFPGAVQALVAALDAQPEANAAAAVPGVGRNRARTTRGIVEAGDLAGNLYALRGDFVRRCRESGRRLPFGAIGDDSIVGMLAKLDLRSGGPWRNERILAVVGARFGFDELLPRSPRHAALFLRRLRRYCLREIQLQALRAVWKRDGLEAWPDDIRRLYPQILAGDVPLRLDGLNAALKPWVIRQMRRDLDALAGPANAAAR